jgi:hypothetical protein
VAALPLFATFTGLTSRFSGRTRGHVFEQRQSPSTAGSPLNARSLELSKINAMLRFWFVIFAVLAHTVGCSHQPRTGPEPAMSEEDRVFLDLLTAYSAEPSELVRIVSDSTEGPIQHPRDSTGLGAFEELAERLPHGLVSSFLERRNDRVPLSSEVVARLPSGILMRSSIAGELNENPEDGIFHLPDGRGAAMSIFSRVGFDASGERALVHEAWVCGPRCGGTSLILLEKGAGGRWHIVERKRGWVF